MRARSSTDARKSRAARRWLVCFALSLASCRSGPSEGNAARDARQAPLVEIADLALPGRAVRFDYQDLDAKLGRLVIAHMNDDAVVFIDLRTDAVLGRLTGIPTPRGVVVAADAGLVFVTSSPHQLVAIDLTSLRELRRVDTGNGPDGVAWDARDKIVGVSDQRDGALSLIGDAGSGERRQVPLGSETGNVAFDDGRGWFWITVVTSGSSSELVAVDPGSAGIATRIALPGCAGAHGLRLHPDGSCAFIACESNDVLVRVELDGAHATVSAGTGSGPDVMSIDPSHGWLYVAAESGDLTIFDIGQPGLGLVGRDHPGDDAHSVAVDATTQRVFFPLAKGPAGTPVLRIMHPRGS